MKGYFIRGRSRKGYHKLGEVSPIGLILCGEKNRGQIELLQLDQGEIRVAECMVVLPPREAKLGHRPPPSSGILSSRMSKSSIKTFLSQKYHY